MNKHSPNEINKKLYLLNEKITIGRYCRSNRPMPIIGKLADCQYYRCIPSLFQVQQ